MVTLLRSCSIGVTVVTSQSLPRAGAWHVARMGRVKVASTGLSSYHTSPTGDQRGGIERQGTNQYPFLTHQNIVSA